MAKKKRVEKYKGLPILDAEGPIAVDVTAKDVRGARPRDPKQCAGAVAITRSIGAQAEVHISRTYVKYGKFWIRFRTPERLAREIVSFDRASKFEPGVYVLRPVAPAHRVGVKRVKSTKKPTRKCRRTVNIRKAKQWGRHA